MGAEQPPDDGNVGAHVLAEIRRRSKRARRFDWRFPAAMAAAMLGLSVVLALFTITAQRADDRAATDDLRAQVARLEQTSAAAEERATEAARQADETQRQAVETQRLVEEVRVIAADVDQLLIGDQERAARGRQIVADALETLRTGIAEEVAKIGAESRARDDEQLARLEELLTEVEGKPGLAGETGPAGPAGPPAPPAEPPPPPPPEEPPTTTTGTTTPAPAPVADPPPICGTPEAVGAPSCLMP